MEKGAAFFDFWGELQSNCSFSESAAGMHGGFIPAKRSRLDDGGFLPTDGSRLDDGGFLPADRSRLDDGGFLPTDLNARTRLLAFLLFSSQIALISSLWTKMPLKHLFYLKILIYTIKHMECLEIDYKNKVKGALNVNI